MLYKVMCLIISFILFGYEIRGCEQEDKCLILSNRSPRNVPFHKIFSDLNPDNMVLMVPANLLEEADENEFKGCYFKIIKIKEYFNAGSVEVEAYKLHDYWPFTKIAVLSEPDILRAGRLRDFFSLKGQSYGSALAFRDKAIMKDYLSKSGIAVPRFTRIESAADIWGFITHENKLPIVVKPTRGTATKHTNVLSDMNQVKEFMSFSMTFRDNYDSIYEAEEFIDGIMYHVDGIVASGNILASWPSRYLDTSLGMLQGKVFGTHLLSIENPMVVRLNSYAKEVLKSLPTPTETAFHLELFHTASDDLIFCEIAARVAGGFIRESWMEAFDLDLGKEFLRLQLGKPPSDQLNGFPWKPAYIAGEIAFPVKPGILLTVPTVCPFEWVKKYNLGLKEGDVVENAKSIFDAVVEARIIASDEISFMDRYKQFSEWFSLNTKWG